MRFSSGSDNRLTLGSFPAETVETWKNIVTVASTSSARAQWTDGGRRAREGGLACRHLRARRAPLRGYPGVALVASHQPDALGLPSRAWPLDGSDQAARDRTASLVATFGDAGPQRDSDEDE